MPKNPNETINCETTELTTVHFSVVSSVVTLLRFKSKFAFMITNSCQYASFQILSRFGAQRLPAEVGFYGKDPRMDFDFIRTTHAENPKHRTDQAQTKKTPPVRAGLSQGGKGRGRR